MPRRLFFWPSVQRIAPLFSAVSLMTGLALDNTFSLSLTTELHAAEASKPMKITTIEGISEHRLENGLKVLLFPDPSKPTVTVNCTIFVGSRHEGYGEAGMAHLLASRP